MSSEQEKNRGMSQTYVRWRASQIWPVILGNRALWSQTGNELPCVLLASPHCLLCFLVCSVTHISWAISGVLPWVTALFFWHFLFPVESKLKVNGVQVSAFGSQGKNVSTYIYAMSWMSHDSVALSKIILLKIYSPSLEQHFE